MEAILNYLNELNEVFFSGAGVKETSFYPPFSLLVNTLGETLPLQVKLLSHPANMGAGIPDGGFFTADLLQINAEGTPFEGLTPDRGVVELKPFDYDLQKLAESEQTQKYLDRYGMVLVSNFWGFQIVAKDENGKPQLEEKFQLAETVAEFKTALRKPRALAKQKGQALAEYLRRALIRQAPLTRPEDLAWLLASYARDAKDRVENADPDTLKSMKEALETALEMTFDGEKGNNFFQSTLVQTLFYGIFSAWALKAKQENDPSKKFDWLTTVRYLQAPVVQTLFDETAKYQHLNELNIVELLDWTANALNRVDEREFFKAFHEDSAVQYFYEPFLEAFDPELRKELGVWYTPPEIVEYMVERVDRVLRTELGYPLGLADENVFVLDPCCGTGAFLLGVIHRIQKTLEEEMGSSMVGLELKDAILKRIIGFEIIPAPYVIAHLQIGMWLSQNNIPLKQIGKEKQRAKIYLTNALTGWDKKNQLPIIFPNMREERDQAQAAKIDAPILVILGNPPYNAYAGVSPKEENNLVSPYKETIFKEWGIRKFNLDDLYVRFFKVAENKIARQTKGLVCFISNYSYINDPSFVVMRQSLLSTFSNIYIDNLNGSSRETGKVTPDGKPDPSVFSTDLNKAGIRVGTAIAILIRDKKQKNTNVFYRDFWGKTKRADLLHSLTEKILNPYIKVAPLKENWLSFKAMTQNHSDYTNWPKLTELSLELPENGLMEKRRGALIDVNRELLKKRMILYFDPLVSWEELVMEKHKLTNKAAAFEPIKSRTIALKYERFSEQAICRFGMRPFDVQFAYYTQIDSLWNSARPGYASQLWLGNEFLISRYKGVNMFGGVPVGYTTLFSEGHYLQPNSGVFPFRLKRNGKPKRKPDAASLFNIEPDPEKIIANLSDPARAYLAKLGFAEPDENPEQAALIWLHALAVGYSPAYLTENADGVRMDWPRIPLPNNASILEKSAYLGRQIADLLDTEKPFFSISGQKLKIVGKICKIDGESILEVDLKLSANWGHGGDGRPVMPGKGKTDLRPWTEAERAELLAAAQTLNLTEAELWAAVGERAVDVWLNDETYWQAIPERAWDYTIGGYQVLKKWLSYRDERVLERPLEVAEARYFTETVRRLSTLCLLQPALDANYRAVVAHLYSWES